jgi:hypothetical protein
LGSLAGGFADLRLQRDPCDFLFNLHSSNDDSFFVILFGNAKLNEQG